MSLPVITTLRAVPSGAKGLVRDLRIRWALEEAGRDYDVRLVDHADTKQQPYLSQQPFGQVPCYDENGVHMVESGAIVLHIAQSSPALLPMHAQQRANAIGWIFAALNSLEPQIVHLMNVDYFHRKEEWAPLARPTAEAAVKQRLNLLAEALGDQDYLTGEFSAGDLMIASVLRFARHTDLVTGHKVLGPYLARCEARPAFVRAHDAQMQLYEPAPA